MALTYDQMNAVTTKYHVKKIVQQAYDSNVFMRRMVEGGRVKVVSGGLKLFHPIRYKQLGTAAFIDPDSARVVENIETRTALELDWTYMVGNLSMTWSEKVKNRGDSAIIKLMDDKVTEIKEDVYQQFATVLYQAQASKTSLQIDGLYQIIQDPSTATTYAGISGGTGGDAANWKAGFYDSSTTSLALFGSTGSLEYAIRSCSFGGSNPNLFVTTRKMAGIYASKLQPSERRQPGNGKSGAGHDTLAFMGVPILVDPQVSTGDWFCLNTDHLWMYVQSGYNFTPKGWEEDPERYYTDVNMLSWVGNMVCDLRRTQGAFSALTS